MSEILDKNLSYIKEYNIALAEKISAVSEYTKNFEINTNFSQEYNLLIDGIPVHSLTGAEQEAKEALAQVSRKSVNSLHVLYGLGLGYLYDTFSQTSYGNVIVFEPDVELLHYVLNIVDFSAEFSKKRTYFVSDVETFKHTFEKLYRYHTHVSFSTLDYYIHNKPKEFKFIEEIVNKTFALTSHNFSFQVNEMYSFLCSTFEALDKKLTTPLLNDYKNIFENKPALIVSAGPSLGKNIEYIKKYKDNFIIFCVGTALKTLLSNGITPDFINIIEKTDTLNHFNFEQTKDMRLICESYTNKDAITKEFKKVFITGSDEIETSRWFLEKRNKADSYFETKGTVAYHAIYSAYTLGCNPIVLIGQDLAYSNGNCYAQGSFYEDLKCIYDENLQKYVIRPQNYEKFRDSYCDYNNSSIEKRNRVVDRFLKSANDNLKTVSGQNGEKLPTSSTYHLFISYISDFGKNYGANIKLFNCSTGGAQINNFENKDICTVAKTYSQKKLDKEQLFLKSDDENSTDIQEITASLNQDIKTIDILTPLLQKGLTLVTKLKKELNSNIYTNKAMDCFDDATNLYIEIQNKYLSQTKLLIPPCSKIISELSYNIKEYNIVSNLYYAKKICYLLEIFYGETPQKLEYIKKVLQETITSLENKNESSIAKS